MKNKMTYRMRNRMRNQMKKLLQPAVLIVCVLALTGCTGKTDSTTSHEPLIQHTDTGATSDPAADNKKDMERTSAETESAASNRETVSSDIEACIREKMDTFEEDCTLTGLWYDRERSERIIDSYMEYGRGASNGVKRDDVIVILSDLKTGENTWSFEPNAVYTDWNWILIRDGETSEWVVDDYGNE